MAGAPSFLRVYTYRCPRPAFLLNVCLRIATLQVHKHTDRIFKTHASPDTQVSPYLGRCAGRCSERWMQRFLRSGLRFLHMNTSQCDRWIRWGFCVSEEPPNCFHRGRPRLCSTDSPQGLPASTSAPTPVIARLFVIVPITSCYSEKVCCVSPEIT